MAFGGFSEGGQSQPMAEINTTPLVDVMLVLLVIFIITAPLFNQAVPIDLPKVDSKALDDKPAVLRVSLDADGLTYINGEKFDAESFGSGLSNFSAASKAPEMHLRADRNTRYERVAEVMAMAQKAGIAKIAFVTDAPKKQ